MGNRVHVGIRKIEEINLDGTSRYQFGPWYQIYCYDDSAECSEYVGGVNDTSLDDEHIKSVLTDVGAAFSWIQEHEGEWDGLSDWALEHGMYVMDEWYDAEEVSAAWREMSEFNE